MSDSTPVLTPLNTSKLTYPVKVPVYREYGPVLVNSILSFFKTMDSPLQSGPGFKANRTKVLKGLIEDVSKIESPFTPDVVSSLNDILNPSKSKVVVDVSDDVSSLFESLNEDDTPDEDNTPS